jgi:hypothetical protein
MRFTITIIALLFSFACTDHHLSCTTNKDLWREKVAIKIPLGHTVCEPGTQTGIRFAQLISDSRCPANVNCVTAGNAEVLLEIYQDKIVLDSFELTTREPVKEVLLNGTHLIFRLLQVNPYPEYSEERQNVKYNILLEIDPV